MLTADVAELGAGLRDYLRRVRDGEEVVVTEQGQEIARLVPAPRPGPTDAAYADLVARGLVIPPVREPSQDTSDLPLASAAGGLLLQALLAERAEGR